MQSQRSILAQIYGAERHRQLAALASDIGFELVVVATAEEAAEQLKNRSFKVAIMSLGRNQAESCWPLLAKLRGSNTFSIVLSRTASECPKLRLDCFDVGARMVTDDSASVRHVLGLLAEEGSGGGSYTCPTCQLGGLTEDELHRHYPLFHGSEPNHVGAVCPVCLCPQHNLDVHLHNCHGPVHEREPLRPEFAAFSWVVCRRPEDGKFAMVNKPAGLCGGRPRYWLPAGQVDAAETFVEAAVREVREEAGLEVRVVGALRFMLQGGVTPRVALLAEPVGAAQNLKSVPDFESVGALWVDAQEVVNKLDPNADFRGREPAKYFPAVAQGRMRVLPVDTPGFQQLEQTVAALTAKPRDALSRADFDSFAAAWAKLRTEYPADAFRES